MNELIRVSQPQSHRVAQVENEDEAAVSADKDRPSWGSEPYRYELQKRNRTLV